MALHLAIAYPDLFRGAFLDAGADPLGDKALPLPPRPLTELFRAHSRLAFFAGGADGGPLSETRDSLAALHRWCADVGAMRTDPGLGHEIAPGSALGWAFATLEKPCVQTAADQTCWRKLDADVQAELGRAREALARGNPREATSRLDGVDRRFGGLAAPDSVQLSDEIAARAGRSN